MKKMIFKKSIIIIFLALIIFSAFCFFNHIKVGDLMAWNSADIYDPSALQNLTDEERKFLEEIVRVARERVNHEVVYDPAYVKINYPNGDVPEDQGVCADVIIRIYRGLEIDLQKEIHEDISENFDHYPKLWGLEKPDPNIDHRRVPNLMAFFKREGQTLPITENPNDYLPGDIVVWSLSHGKTHIGIVIDELSSDKQRPLIVHNVGAGPKMNDVLFRWKIVGHFRYFSDTLSYKK